MDPPRLIIIDDDVGMLKKAVAGHGPFQAPWLPITDPDGGLEVIYALREPGVKVLGITCTMGCSSTDVCMESVKKILELTDNEDIPVLRGAASPDELGQHTEAAHFIVNTVMSHPGQVEIIATAPLTNIATALMLEPCLPMNWKALHVGTGEFMGALGEVSDAVYYSRASSYEDLNINVDPEAARYVLAYGGDFIFYPNEIMDDAAMTNADRRALKRADTPLSKWVAAETFPHVYMFSLLSRITGQDGGMKLHGVIPAAVAFEPNLAEPPMELRVAMEQQEKGGYYFVTTEDPSVPTRKVFVRVTDPKKIEEQLVERCQ